MSCELATRLFKLARPAGMMDEGYAWIVTDSVCSVLDRLDPAALHAMEGVVCVRPHVPPDTLRRFASRFSLRFKMDNPESLPLRPTVFQLWAYDTAWAVATAVSKLAGAQDVESTWPPPVADNSTELGRLVPRQGGRKILYALQNTTFQGLAGEFRLDHGQLVSSAYAIVNVVGTAQRNVGFWTPERRFSKELAAPLDGLKPILWPGDVFTVPKGWQLPTAPRRKLRIGVPVKTGFTEFVKVQRNPDTCTVTAVTGYCIDIFDAVMQTLPYAVPYEYVPMESSSHTSLSYTNMTVQVSLRYYDAMVGDTTIIANRSEYIDFTLPYTESGVQMIVPMKDGRSKSFWLFLKPLTSDLWLAILTLFVFTGFVVWLIERRVENSELRADSYYAQQLFNVSYFNFFTLRTAPRERLQHNLSKFALINWMLVAWLLEKNYSASLTSMMTVRQLQPTFSDIDELKKNGYYVGYQDGSFVKDLLINSLSFDERKLRKYSGVEQYHEALKNGTWNGGVAAIFDEVPFLKLLKGKYCDENDYSMVGRVYKTGGFGFVFPKGSPLVPDVSRAILNVTEGEEMVKIERTWFQGRSQKI